MDDDTAGTDAPTAREVLLNEVMAAAAAGDGAAVFTLRTSFGPEIERVVRGVASSRGARLSADDVDQLATDVSMELFRLAKGWNPDFGVPPWVWARHRVAAVVDGYVGQHTRSLEVVEQAQAERADGPASPGHEPPTLEVVARLAEQDPVVALLWDAVSQVATPRDQFLFFETELQSSLGDRSPAATVGALIGLRPEAVRQQTRRVRVRLLELAAADPRYAGLADLAIVA